MVKKILTLSLCTIMLLNQQAQAQALPVAINPASAAIALTIKQGLLNQGIAGTSSSIIAAQIKAGQYMGVTVGRVATGSFLSVRSPTILAIGAVLIVGSILYTANKDFDFNMNSDGTVTSKKVLTNNLDTSFAPAFDTSNNMYYGSTMPNGYFPSLASYAAAAAKLLNSMNGSAGAGWGGGTYKVSNCYQYGNYIRCTVDSNVGPRFNVDMGNVGAAPMACGAGNFVAFAGSIPVCAPLTPPPPDPNLPPVYDTRTQDFTSAISAITAQEKIKPVDPGVIANIVNAIGQQMNQDPTYSGPPIPVVDSATVVDGLKNGGYSLPTIADMTNPVNSSEVMYDPMNPPSPVSTGNTNTGTVPTYNPSTPGTSTQDPSPTKPDLGIDPGIAAPGLILEATPTDQMIFSPIFNLLPDFKGLTFQENASVCPFNKPFVIPYFNNKEYSFNFICDFFQTAAPTLQAVSLIAFTLVSAVIVLGA